MFNENERENVGKKIHGKQENDEKNGKHVLKHVLFNSLTTCFSTPGPAVPGGSGAHTTGEPAACATVQAEVERVRRRIIAIISNHVDSKD